MAKTSPESVVLRFIDAINTGDLEVLAALTAPRYTFIDMAGDVYVVEGAEAVKASWNEYLSAVPEYRILVDHVMRSGSGVAIVGRTTGSHLDPNVERNEVVLWVAELADDRIAKWRIYSTWMCRRNETGPEGG